MDMVKVLALICAAAGAAAGADFSIQLGNPVAADAKKIDKVKMSVMAVRAQGCADPGKATFTGIAVRVTGGKVESATLAFAEGSAPGAFAVIGGWPAANPWVAVMTAECLGAKAGAVVPVNEQGSYVREASRFFAHAPTDAEVNAVLKTITGGSK